jgi:2-polyprenyl-3-methyl-5-hydroxy-6-metoxy-1,4-benzoquinol methylase
MLQLTKFYEQCYQDFEQSNSVLSNVPVEILSKNLLDFIDQKRSMMSKKNLRYYIDQLVWTQKSEHIDDPTFDIELKKQIVYGLHLKNKLFGTYCISIKILRPIIEYINLVENRPARILEIGSGSGQLSMAMYEQFKNTSLKVEMTGSDIVPEYVEAANLLAREKKYDINYKVIDALQLDQLPANSYDIVFTLHSMHHFLPEQLIKIMAGARSVASQGFIGVDAYRGLFNLCFMAILGGGKSLVSLNPVFYHDSVISGRRMYSAKQLEIMARVGCPGSTVVAENLKPGLTVVKVFS